MNKRNLIAVLLVSLFSNQIIAAAVRHKSYVGCYYYDQKNPYASILRKRSWVWARTPTKEYLSVSGHYSGGFFVVNKSDISKEEMLLACQRSIPASKKVLKMVALNHFYQSQEFVFSFVNELKVVVIGASLSDPGNLQRKIKLMPRKPYWNGRFADGPIWTDYLSRHFDVAIDNWSYGGSKTSLKINHQKTFFPRLQVWIQNNLITGNMLDTIHSYFRTRKPDHKMLKDTLFILVGGANNYLHKAVMLKQEYPLLRKNKHRLRGEVTQAVGQTVDDLRLMVDLLYKKGAKNILVLSLSDMPKTPYAKIHHLEVALRLLSVKHNKQLRNFLRKKRKKVRSSSDLDLKLIWMNVIPFVQELIRHKKEYGFSKLVEPCHHGFYGMYKGRTCPPEERGQYFFFDKLHPNSLVHCHLSLFLLRQFRKEGFLPADANYRSREEKISTCNRLLSLYQQY